MIDIKKMRYDRDRGTEYYKILDISNWQLKCLYQLLRVEEERARIMNDGNRGVKELREALEPLAQERKWEQRSGGTEAC